MGGTVGVSKFYDNSQSDDEGYYSIDGQGKGSSVNVEELQAEITKHKNQYRSGLVNPTILDAPYLNRYPFNEFRFVKKLGKGRFSTVYKAINLKDESIKVAIKEMKIPEMIKQEFEDFLYELNILSQLSHPSIMNLISVYDSAASSSHSSSSVSKFFVVLEYLQGGELIHAILRSGRYNEDDVLFFMNQIISGIHYLHIRGIVHGNIIPENFILLNQRLDDRKLNRIKIVGFENAESVQQPRNLRKPLIDEHFRAPELFSKDESLVSSTTKEADIWSFGVILFLLLSGSLPSKLFEEGNTASLSHSLVGCFTYFLLL
jgi:serine/threonine protein kinase